MQSILYHFWSQFPGQYQFKQLMAHRKTAAKSSDHLQKTQQMLGELSKYDVSPQQQLAELSTAFSPQPPSPHFLHPLYPGYSIPLSNIHILFGPEGHGRRSLIHYSNRSTKYPILEIYAAQLTELQFSKKLLQLISRAENVDPPPNCIVNDQITFSGLTEMIMKGRQEKLLVVVTCAEKLTEMKKQTILYNLLEWIKGEVGERVALYLITSDCNFMQRLEKRVKSRLTAAFTFWQLPSAEAVLGVMGRRVAMGSRCLALSKVLQQILQDTRTIDYIAEMLMNRESSIASYLNAFRQAIIMAEFKKFEEDPVPYFLGLLDVAFCQCNRNHQVASLRNLNLPDLVVIALIIVLARKSTALTLTNIMKEFIESKTRITTAKGVGSVFAYTNITLQRSFENLIANKIIAVDQSEVISCGTAHSLQSFVEMERFLKENKFAPPFVIDILNESI